MAALISVSDDMTFALSNAHFSYVLRVTPEGHVENLHYGGVLSDPLNAPRHYRRVTRHAATIFEDVPNYSLSDMPQDFPSFGQSDYRFPALHGRNADGNSMFSFRYTCLLYTSPSPRDRG